MKTSQILEIFRQFDADIYPPAALLAKIHNYHPVENHIGCSSSYIIHLICDMADPNLYLKVQHLYERHDIEHEYKVMHWLEDKLPIPKVIDYCETQNTGFLLMRELSGIPASDPLILKDPMQLARLLATSLQLVHSLPIADCPFDQTLKQKLRHAQTNINKGWVTKNMFNPENRDRTPQDIYHEVVATQPETEDLVFTHGDYCLPNIILQDNQLSGFVDVGNAGIADRYHDLALAVRSLGYNLSADCSRQAIEYFFDCYGIKDVDYKKIDYYVLLDELV
jgi:aminoglycoside phosphotransferase